MPLDRQIVTVPFAQGVDTQPDPKQLEVGKLLQADNVIFESPRQLRKRNGYGNGNSPFVSPLSIASTVQGTAVLFSQTAVASQAGSLVGSYVWAQRNAYDPMAVSAYPLTANGAAQLDGLDVALGATGTIAVLQYVLGEWLDCIIIDPTTHQTVVRHRLLTGASVVSTVTLARVLQNSNIGDGNEFYCVWSDPGPHTYVWSVASNSASATLTSSGHVYTAATSGQHLILGRLSTSTLILSTTKGADERVFAATGSELGRLALCSVSPSELHCVYQDPAYGVRDVIVDESGSIATQVVGSTGIIAGVTIYDVAPSTVANVVVRDANTNYQRYSITSSPSATLVSEFPRGGTPFSRPWCDSDGHMFLVFYSQAPGPVADFSSTFDSQLIPLI